MKEKEGLIGKTADKLYKSWPKAALVEGGVALGSAILGFAALAKLAALTLAAHTTVRVVHKPVRDSSLV